MKAIYLVALSLSVLLSACAGGTFQTAGQYESGKQALYAGNYPTALGYFQEAAQANPNAVYGATLRLGILTYVGQTQYLTGNYAGARQSLRKELSQHPSDHVAHALPWTCGSPSRKSPGRSGVYRKRHERNRCLS